MKLAPVKCKQVKSLLANLGFYRVKTNKGSHEKWRHDCFNGQQRNVTVDCPDAPFDDFLMGSMARQAGCPKRQFWKCCLGMACHTTLIPKSSPA